MSVGIRALHSFYQHIGRISYRAILSTRYLSADASLMSSTKLKVSRKRLRYLCFNLLYPLNQPSDRIVGHDKNLW